MGASSGDVIGLVWFKPAHWDRVRALVPDRDAMHVRYDEWLTVALQAERDAKAAGHTVHRFTIDPDQLVGWCALRGRQPDAAARAEYVTDQLRHTDA